MIKVVVDAFGGDRSPFVNVEGSITDEDDKRKDKDDMWQ